MRKKNKPIKYYDDTLNIKIIYVYKSRCKNFIYYKCNNQNLCKGRGKINKEKKEFIITKQM